jgi:chemotaxis signal transduction protein
MMGLATSLSQRASELRRQFDRAFVAPVRLDPAVDVNLLRITAGARDYAVRLASVSGLFADRKITQVPGSSAGLRGIAAFRGAILPVYDLAALLGHGQSHAPRWLVIAAAAPVALAFDGFAGQLRVPPHRIVARLADRQTAGGTGEYVRTDDFTGPVLCLPSVLETIAAPRKQEHGNRRDDS